MIQTTTSIFIDRSHPKKDGKCSVSIRVTSQRVKKYYNTGLSIEAIQFDRIMNAKRRSPEDSNIYNKLRSFETKAIKDIESLDDSFSFSRFEDLYLKNKQAPHTVESGFDSYIEELTELGQLGTAINYRCAKQSILSFKKDLRYSDVTISFLKKYERWMDINGKSKTTIGMYLRSLRAILNKSKLDKALYPFGLKKYQIPIGGNVKKALTLDEISKIYNYQTKPNSSEEMARDYWLFLYQCNGMNVIDFCRLKRININDDSLEFVRAKTRKTTKKEVKTDVSLKQISKDVISKYGQPSLSPNNFVFPHLKAGLTDLEERRIIQQLTKTINKYMKRIALAVGIEKEVTTYFARHSFATILRNSGASVSFISEALSHSDTKTTENYLAGFTKEVKHTTTEILNITKAS